MKMSKILTTSAAALAAATMAHAATIELYVTGSSAFRGETTRAIVNLLGGNSDNDPVTLPTGGYSHSATTNTRAALLGASRASFQGTIGADTVIIKTTWSGSAKGIQGVAANGTPTLTETFLTVNGGAASGTANVTATTAVTPEVAMADNEQGSTLFNGKFLRTTAYSNLTVTQVGIVPFQFVKSNPAALTGTASTRWSALTDMTTQSARANWTNGTGILPLSLYTGVASDSSVNVYASGRDPDSGTRIITFAESGIGANTVVKQFTPAAGTPALYAATTINGVPVVAGNGGESSGSSSSGLVFKMNAATLTNIFVAYAGVSDAAALPANYRLTYNGVAYSEDNVKNGKYTLWGVENLMYKSTLAASKKGVADALATAIQGLATIKLDDMQVGRGADGGTVTN